MASFDTLPVDILLSIFAHSPPVSVRRCQQVCHSLRNLIGANDYLQYILQLDTCGYVEPLHPRTDLSYAEKTQILCEHKAKWGDPTVITPVHHELPSYRTTDIDALVKGTFVWGRTVAGEDCLRIVFYQLPSTNRNTGFKQWSIDLENEYDGFWIDPEQDLVVVAEARSGWPSTDPYNIHLRSMSTNQPHPRAAVGRSILRYTPLSGSWHDGWRIWIFGDLLAGLFNLGDSTNIVIWNWITGRELTHLTFTDDGAYHFFEPLSESSFVICCSLRSPDIDPSFPKETLGWLRVYRFDPQSPVPMQAMHVVSLALPESKSTMPYHSLALHAAPIASSLSAQSQHGSPAKIYDLAPSNRLLRVDVSFPVRSAIPSLVGSLYVSSSVLLDTLSKEAPQDLYQPNRKLVSWAEWGDRACWVDHSKLYPHRKPRMFGHRLVAQRMRDCDTPLPGVCVIDFDRRRLTSRGTCALSDIHNLGQITRDTRAETICRELTLAVEGVDFGTEGCWTWIDEEHLVIQKRTLTPQEKFSLLIYNF